MAMATTEKPAKAERKPRKVPKGVEVNRVLWASTGHLKPDEAGWLEQRALAQGEYGFIVNLDTISRHVTELRKTSPDFMLGEGYTGVHELARRERCTYVMFDRDAEYLPGVASYEW